MWDPAPHLLFLCKCTGPFLRCLLAGMVWHSSNRFNAKFDELKEVMLFWVMPPVGGAAISTKSIFSYPLIHGVHLFLVPFVFIFAGEGGRQYYIYV